MLKSADDLPRPTVTPAELPTFEILHHPDGRTEMLAARARAEARAQEAGASVTFTQDMDEAVRAAADMARRGDTVLLSPACASSTSMRSTRARVWHSPPSSRRRSIISRHILSPFSRLARVGSPSTPLADSLWVYASQPTLRQIGRAS